MYHIFLLSSLIYQGVTDPAKVEAVTTIRSCLEIVPTIRNDFWGQPLSIQR